MTHRLGRLEGDAAIADRYRLYDLTRLDPWRGSKHNCFNVCFLHLEEGAIASAIVSNTQMIMAMILSGSFGMECWPVYLEPLIWISTVRSHDYLARAS